MCDDVRQENNGKLMLIGVYTPNIAITQLPYTAQSLAFFQHLEIERLGMYTLRFQLSNLETGTPLASAMMMMDIQQALVLPGTGINVVRFGSVRFDRAGAYHLNTVVDGQNEVFTHTFDVILNIPQIPQGPGQLMPGQFPGR